MKLLRSKIIKILMCVMIILIWTINSSMVCSASQIQSVDIMPFRYKLIDDLQLPLHNSYFFNTRFVYNEQNDIINDLKMQNAEYETQIQQLKAEIEQLKLQLDDINNVDNIPNTINYNPHSKSGYSIKQLNKMLEGTGLANTGESFFQMENEHEVNALFAMAVAMHESAYGTKKANTHNYFGFRGKSGWMKFISQHECIMYFGKLIHNSYGSRTSIDSIESKYCPDGSDWAGMVKKHMKQLHNKLI